MREIVHMLGHGLRELGHHLGERDHGKAHGDPTLIPCAAALMVDVMVDVDGQALRHGVPLPVARARAIEARADAWVRCYGREASDMAVRGLHSIKPEAMLSPRTRAIVRRREAEARRTEAETRAREHAVWFAEHYAILERCAPELARELYPPPRRWPRVAAVALAVVLVLLGIA